MQMLTMKTLQIPQPSSLLDSDSSESEIRNDRFRHVISGSHFLEIVFLQFSTCTQLTQVETCILTTAAWVSLWMSAILKMVFFCGTYDLICARISSVGLWQLYGFNFSSLCPCCWAVGSNSWFLYCGSSLYPCCWVVGSNSWFLYCGLYTLTSCSNSKSVSLCVVCLLVDMAMEEAVLHTTW
jgi:hypothetical protein